MLQEYGNKRHIKSLILTILQIQYIPLSLGLVWDSTSLYLSSVLS